MQSCARSWGILFAKAANPRRAPCRHLSGKARPVGKLQCSIPAVRCVGTSAVYSARQIERILPRHDDFAERHIGPGEREKREMLDALGLEVRITQHGTITYHGIKCFLIKRTNNRDRCLL